MKDTQGQNLEVGDRKSPSLAFTRHLECSIALILLKAKVYVSDGDKAHRDKRPHLEAIVWHVTACQYPPRATLVL